MNELLKQYEQHITPTRKEFAKIVTHLLKTLEGEKALVFLMYYCALGVGMTEHVSDWITRAGMACLAQGYQELGQSLIKHAHEEAGHEILFRNDTYALIKLYHKKYNRQFLAETFLNQPLSPGVLQYRKLHESCIAGSMPYGQLAIEYEIEKISTTHGPSLLIRCLREQGPALLKALSFIRSHVKLDIKHTKFNAKTLSHFLTQFPDTLLPLVHYGEQALRTYGEFLLDCEKLTIGIEMT